jgi:hypothetical protein
LVALLLLLEQEVGAADVDGRGVAERGEEQLCGGGRRGGGGCWRRR